MSFAQYFYIYILVFITNICLGQSNSSIQVSICIQHAATYNHVLGASVIIKKIDDNSVIMQVDSMYSAVFIPANFEIGYKYSISINKKGFYPLDTIITTRVTSTSNKQRLGLFLQPLICHQIKGVIFEANGLDKIQQGKVLITNLYTKEFWEVDINNGYYEFCGLSNYPYELRTLVEGYFDTKDRVQLSLDRSLKQDEQELSLNMKVTKNYEKAFFDGDSIIIRNLTFVDATSILSILGEEEIDRLVQVMKQMPHLLLSIAVQAEVFMNTRFDRKLAEQRARILEHRLTVGGISPHRYLLICKGEIDESNSECCTSQRVSLWLRK